MVVVFLGVTCISDKPKKHSSICTYIYMIYVCIYIIPQCILSFIGKIVKSPNKSPFINLFQCQCSKSTKILRKTRTGRGHWAGSEASPTSRRWMWKLSIICRSFSKRETPMVNSTGIGIYLDPLFSDSQFFGWMTVNYVLTMVLTMSHITRHCDFTN